MLYKALLIASVASVAVAQTATSSAATSTGTSSCAAQNILDSCKGTIQAQLNSCSTNDYSCLCTNYINMLQCYANCPDDIGVQTVQQQRQQNCEAASVYGSTTILGTATSSSGASSATSTSSESAVQTGFASATSTTSGSSSAASETSSSGAEKVKTAGGLLALVFAGAAAFL